jgi:hypothetical protein
VGVVSEAANSLFKAGCDVLRHSWAGEEIVLRDVGRKSLNLARSQSVRDETRMGGSNAVPGRPRAKGLYAERLSLYHLHRKPGGMPPAQVRAFGRSLFFVSSFRESCPNADKIAVRLLSVPQPALEEGR